MNKIRFALLVLITFCSIQKAHADHAVHGGCSACALGSRTLLYQGLKTKPSTRVFFIYDITHLDESIGQVHSWTPGFEWSVSQKFSFAGSFPILFIDHNFGDNHQGLGDITLQGKYLLWDKQKTFSFVTSSFSVPTGQSEKGLGRGALGQQVDYFLGYHWGRWDLYGIAGINFGYESNLEPLLVVSQGVRSPKFLKQLYFSLSVLENIYLDSSIFNSVASKIYLEPQLMMALNKKQSLLVTFSNRISLYDGLSRKRGVTLTPTSQALLSDVLVSGTLGLHYNFKK